MTAISAFRVKQHSQIFSLFFRNRIQYIALYQLHNSQALLNLRRGYFMHFTTVDQYHNVKHWCMMVVFKLLTAVILKK